MRKGILTAMSALIVSAWGAVASDASATQAGVSRGLTLYETSQIKSGNGCPTATVAQRGGNVKSVSTIADLAGEYVMTYSTLLSSGVDGGNGATVAAIEGTDSISITDFWQSGAVVKAKVDLTAMTITIPNQVIGTSSSYGDYDIAYCTTSATADRTTELTGTISADGVITITSWWGIFFTDDTYSGYTYGLYYNTAMEPANSTMSYKVYSSGDTTEYSFNVIVEQIDDETVAVKNFYNYGKTVEVTVSVDTTAFIRSQNAYTHPSYGDFYTYSLVYNVSSSTSPLKSYDEFIECDKASDARTISWGAWNVLCFIDKTTYWTGEFIISGKIETTFDIQYPSPIALTLDGAGTADSPYTVSTPEEWNHLAKYIYNSQDPLTGKYVKIACDIDFTGDTIKPLGYRHTEQFNGDLDGNGKTIKGISAVSDNQYFAGLINTAGPDSYIHDLTVEGTVTLNYYYGAGVVAYLYGDMKNVVNKVDVDGYYAAGLACYVGEGSSVTDCVNEGSITGTTLNLAGLVAFSLAGAYYENCYNRGAVTFNGSLSNTYTAGLISSAYPCTMINCGNEGAVTATGGYGGGAGLIGYITSTSGSTDSFYIKNCYNAADVTVTYGAAGLIKSVGTTYPPVVMEDCYNTGNITSSHTSSSSGQYVAGLAGRYCRSSTYTNCWNSGKITAGNLSDVAGLFAYYGGTGSESNTTVIKNCYNTGDIECSSQYVGGIVAYTGTYTYIDSCYNTGNVTGKYYTGGITGIMASSSSITNCWNAGDVTVTLNRAGGIVGSVQYSTEISNCFNVGDITTQSTSKGTTSSSSGYGIGGIVGVSAAAISNTYNAGTITGASRVGGIVGSSYKSSSAYPTIDRCYSIGTIAADADTCGNIMGSSVYNGSVWASGSTISNTYYLEANDATTGSTTVRDTASAGLSYAQLASLNLGDSWTAGDDYTYPRIATIAGNDYALAYAAAVIPADGDSYASITGGFYLGAPDGVTWTASSEAVSIDGNAVTFNETFSGTLTMTATAGAVSVSTDLTCNVTTVGAGNIAGDDLEVTDVTYYTPSGMRVASPSDDGSAIYIVVRTLSDGSTTVTKEAKK